MGDKRADQRRVQIVEVQLKRLFAGLVLGEAQQQPEGVAVGGDGVRAGVALGDQTFGEERLHRRRERAHDGTPGNRSSLLLMTASNSGTACRYQLFRDRNNWYYSDSGVIPMSVLLHA